MESTFDYSASKTALGECIRNRRIKAQMTIESLATKAGVNRVTIADIERGSANPSFEVLTRIASALEDSMFSFDAMDFFSVGIAHQNHYIIQPTNGNLYDELVKQLETVQNGEATIQVAYAKSSGVDLLTAAFNKFIKAGGHLRILAGIDQKNTTAEALYKLMQLASELYVVHDNAFAQTYHPKIYIVKDEQTAWVAIGSNNLTRGGLYTNYEACNTQVLNLSNALDFSAYHDLTGTFTAYQDASLVEKIDSIEKIQNLLKDGLIVTEQQSRQNASKRSTVDSSQRFGHHTVNAVPSVMEKISVPAKLFIAPDSSTHKGTAVLECETVLKDSEVLVDSFFSLERSSDVQETYWFEMRASTGGSRNILDLSSSAKLQKGTHLGEKDGSIPGGVAFFGLDPLARGVEKNITVVYNGISYFPSTIKFAPNNASWRIQLKGDAQTGDSSLSQFGRTDFANHILVFHKITSDHYVLETMPESELDKLKAHSDFWATNGINRASKAFGKI